MSLTMKTPLLSSTAIPNGVLPGWAMPLRGPRPVFAPEGEGAGGGGGAGAGDGGAGGDAGADGNATSGTLLGAGSGDGAAKDGAAKEGEGEAGDGKAKEGEAGKEGEKAAELTPEQKAEARKKELEAMSPEDRAKAEAEDAEAARIAAVPEDGVYDLKMPDGVTLDADMMKELGPEFAKLGLSNGEAQTLADKFIASQKSKAEASARAWGETVAGWATQASKDAEIGGDKWDATKANAIKAVDKLGTPALKEYLDLTGGGNHPELIRIFSKFGAMISDDSPGDGGRDNPGGKPVKDTASILYPNDPPKGK